jgi:EAL domain-containing protein (putative c-di-GMP-specific phosphodiesterase class I)
VGTGAIRAQDDLGCERGTDFSNDVGEALCGDWLELRYQPKVDLQSFSICGAEAQLYVRHPERGIVAPDGLLPTAGNPLHAPLFRFIVRRVLVDWKVFANQGGAIKIAVNVPASVVVAPDFCAFIKDLLPQDPRFPGCIIEIGEHDMFPDRDRICDAARQLRHYNVWISIDEFGSAFSSLACPHDVPFAELKLDRSFVSGCSSNPLKHGLCQSIVDLGRHLRASVCADGIEDPEDLQALMAIGCDAAQGPLFARPMPARSFAMLLRRGGYLFPLERSSAPSNETVSGMPTLRAAG